MNYNVLKGFALIFLMLIFRPVCMGQAELPEVLKQGKLTEQLNYIEERTRIYEYYRAIREDMFQQIKRNTIDSLRASDSRIAKLITEKNKLNFAIDSLNVLVTGARAGLDEAVRTKNSINILGMNVNKFAYNSVMWIIVASLAGILAIGFLIFRRNLIVAKHTKTDLEELRTEFEAYRKQSRLAREKMSMDHFNEIRRLRTRSTEHNKELKIKEDTSTETKAGNRVLNSEVNSSPETKEDNRVLNSEGNSSPETKEDNRALKIEENTYPETKEDKVEIPGGTKTGRKKKSAGRLRLEEEDQANADL